MAKKNIDINILKTIEKYIKEISKYYDIQGVYLFGSYAKGTNNEDSDIDIAIIVDTITSASAIIRINCFVNLTALPSVFILSVLICPIFYLL